MRISVMQLKRVIHEGLGLTQYEDSDNEDDDIYLDSCGQMHDRHPHESKAAFYERVSDDILDKLNDRSMDDATRRGLRSEYQYLIDQLYNI